MISPDLASFLESGISVLVGTRDDDRIPEVGRALGARVEDGGRAVTVFLPDATSGETLANLRANGRVAVCFSRPQDHRSIQLKGRMLSATPARESDREFLETYRGRFAAMLAFLGLPPRTSFRMAYWPCHAVRFEVEAVFVQTPGPGAGEALGPTAAEANRA